MPFDEIKIAGCKVQGAAGTIGSVRPDGTIVTCEPDVPGTDVRCEDPAFRKANPGICSGFPYLIIKPGVASVCAMRTLKFRVFLSTDKVETEITTGLRWSSSNQAAALIGVLSGKVTGVVEGIATISVEWQDKVAHAQVQVLPSACCDDSKVGMVVVVDNSQSMTQVFNVAFATKLSFAKTQAYRIVGELNAVKDVAALMTFSDTGAEVVPLTDDVAHLKTAVAAIVSTQNSTNIAEALEDAIKILDDDTSLTRKVVLLITDGWNKEGEDPNPIADAFEERGGIIQVLGVRAYGEGFALLNQIATGGFFLNAHNNSYKTIPDQLSGLKGYYCAGNCVPAGDVTINRAALMWGTAVGAFEKWDVVRGAVDLIGGTPPYDLYDLVPGHGLYLDMAGSAPWPLPPDPTGQWRGRIESKAGFDFFSDTTYRLAFKLAGNQRESIEGTAYNYRIRVGVGDESTTMLNEVVTLNEYDQGFTDYYFDFPGGGGGRVVFDLIEQANVGAFGLLLDDVQLIEDPDGIARVMFEDDFNDENSVYIPPACGPSFVLGYGFGYDCYGTGCLSTPPEAQTEDPFPQPDMLETAAGAGGGGGGGGQEGITTFNPAGVFPTHAVVSSLLGRYLPLAGGELSGPLLLADDPAEDLGAATKQYVDQVAAGGVADYVNVDGDTMTGFLTLHADPTADMHAATKKYVDDYVAASSPDLSEYLNLDGGTMLGSLILAQDPTVDLEAATKQYVDGFIEDLADAITAYLPLTGGTLSGLLTLSGAPSNDLHAATKLYVDTAVGGITVPVTSVFGRTGAITATSGDYTTAQVTEVTNLYFTNARAIGATLTGLNVALTGAVGATDTVLQGFGRLENRVALNDAKVTGSDRVLKAGDTMTGLLTMTPSAANTGIIASTGYSLTGSNATSLIDLAGTWNTSGTPTALKLNITDTASNASSNLLDLQVGAASKFAVSKQGHVSLAGAMFFSGASGTVFITMPVSSYILLGSGAYIPGGSFDTAGVRTTDTGAFAFSSTSAPSGTADVLLRRDAANTLAQRNGTTAQAFRLYSNYTDSSNYGRLTVSSGAGFVQLVAERAGTTATQDLYLDATTGTLNFRTATTTRMQLSTSGHLLWPTDNTYDIGASGATRPRNIYAATNVVCSTLQGSVQGGNVLSGAGNILGWFGRSYMWSPSDGVIEFTNSGITDFGRLQLGGTTSSFPAIKRSSAGIDLRLADDSAFTGLSLSLLDLYGAYTNSSNYEKLYAKSNASSSFEIGTLKAGTGTARSLLLNPETGIIQLFGTTSGAPAFKRNSQFIDLRVADDSDWSGMRAGALHTQSLTVDDIASAPALAGTAPTFTDFYGGDGTAMGMAAGFILVGHNGGTVKVPYYNT